MRGEKLEQRAGEIERTLGEYSSAIDEHTSLQRDLNEAKKQIRRGYKKYEEKDLVEVRKAWDKAENVLDKIENSMNENLQRKSDQVKRELSSELGMLEKRLALAKSFGIQVREKWQSKVDSIDEIECSDTASFLGLKEGRDEIRGKLSAVDAGIAKRERAALDAIIASGSDGISAPTLARRLECDEGAADELLSYLIRRKTVKRIAAGGKISYAACGEVQTSDDH